TYDADTALVGSRPESKLRQQVFQFGSVSTPEPPPGLHSGVIALRRDARQPVTLLSFPHSMTSTYRPTSGSRGAPRCDNEGCRRHGSCSTAPTRERLAASLAGCVTRFCAALGLRRLRGSA